MDFEVVRSEIVYHGHVFDVRQDQLRLPDGNLATIDVVDHRGAVTMIPVDGLGQIWFIRQYRHAIQRQLLELPAGAAEIGEAPLISAQRELREEIGMAAGNLEEIGSFYLAPGYSSEFMHIFLATDLQVAPLPADAGRIPENRKNLCQAGASPGRDWKARRLKISYRTVLVQTISGSSWIDLIRPYVRGKPGRVAPGRRLRRWAGRRPAPWLSIVFSLTTAWLSYSRFPHTSHTQAGKLGTVISSSLSQVK